MLQLDVGTCLEAGSDPVAWLLAFAEARLYTQRKLFWGETRDVLRASIHCKDWSPDPAKGSQVLFGEGVADWKKIFEAAESVGGLEYYLIEQEGSRVSEIETARKCLATYRTVHPQ